MPDSPEPFPLMLSISSERFEGERDGDERDHGGDEREEPRLRDAVIEELDPYEGIVEKP